ncbi:MAG: response regulator [bacterium]|nr:response regulator [bacterium]
MSIRGNVLIVDDEIGPLESLRIVMKPHHAVETAVSGQEALQLIATRPFDVVTLDLNMPDINGIEVLKRIKEEDESLEVVIVTGYGTLSTAQQAIRYGAFDYITKPFEVAEIVEVTENAVRKKRLGESMRSVVSGLLAHSRRKETGLTPEGRVGAGEPVMNMSEGTTFPLRDIFALYRELSLVDFVKVLSRILEEKNLHMHQHSERVDLYAMMVAAHLDLPEADRENLRIAAFLHDIGKVGISNDIINKKGPLNEPEWAEVRDHPRRGIQLVEPLSLPHSVLSIILHHHESFDGTGYPKGLRGSDIPMGARIIRVVDSYDAMTSNRPYRKARSDPWVMDEFARCCGTDFDPKIVEVFTEILGRHERLILDNCC